MLRPSAGWFAGFLVAAGVLLGNANPLPAATAALSGIWKVTVFDDRTEVTLALVQIMAKGRSIRAQVLSAPHDLFKNAKVARIQADGPRTVRLTFQTADHTFRMEAYLPDDKEDHRKVLGNMALDGQNNFAWLERTKLTKLDADPEKSQVDSPAKKAFVKATKAKDDDKEDAFKRIETDFAPDPLAYEAGLELVDLLVDKEAKEPVIRRQANKTIKLAELYGPPMKLQAFAQLVLRLARSEKLAALTVSYARQAEKLFTEADSAGLRKAILKRLAEGLRKTDKEEEAAEVDKRIAQLDAVLDKEFLKTNIPFKPDTYAGRKGKSRRVAVLELFTGVQCGPCVAADVAFDALLQTYKPSEVVCLQYHLHAPGPDPLTNADGEERAEFYGADGTPTALLNGKRIEDVGGPRPEAKATYQTLREALDKQLEEPAQARLQLTAQRKGTKIEVAAEVDSLKQTGKDVRLLFVLVEDVVRFPGSNGQRFHHHVVRAFPGGVKGFALEERSAKKTASVDLAKLRKSLNAYLTEWPKKNDFEKDVFPKKDRPLDLKHFKVVALIQVHKKKDKEILQAAQVDVPEAEDK